MADYITASFPDESLSVPLLFVVLRIFFVVLVPFSSLVPLQFSLPRLRVMFPFSHGRDVCLIFLHFAFQGFLSDHLAPVVRR